MIQLFPGRAQPRAEREAAGAAGKPLRGSGDGTHRGQRHPVRLEGVRPEDQVQEDGRHRQVDGEHLQQAGLSPGPGAGADGAGGRGEAAEPGRQTHQQQEDEETERGSQEIQLSQGSPQVRLLERLRADRAAGGDSLCVWRGGGEEDGQDGRAEALQLLDRARETPDRCRAAEHDEPLPGPEPLLPAVLPGAALPAPEGRGVLPRAGEHLQPGPGLPLLLGQEAQETAPQTATEDGLLPGSGTSRPQTRSEGPGVRLLPLQARPPEGVPPPPSSIRPTAQCTTQRPERAPASSTH